MKTGSQSDVFDYTTGEVNTSEVVPPTTRMYPPTGIVVPTLWWVDQEKCNCIGPYHRPLCPDKGKDLGRRVLSREEREENLEALSPTPRILSDDEETG